MPVGNKKRLNYTWHRDERGNVTLKNLKGTSLEMITYTPKVGYFVHWTSYLMEDSIPTTGPYPTETAAKDAIWKRVLNA